MDTLLNNINYLPSNLKNFLFSSLFCHDESKECAVVYTDGACVNQGRGEEAKAGYGVFWRIDHPNNYYGKVHGLQDNNRAELCAAHHAIKQAYDQGYRAITILSDSKFVGFVIDEPEEFRNSSYSDFHDLMDSIDSMRDHIKITVEHIKAHDGHYGNEKADELAKLGVRSKSLETVQRTWRKRKAKKPMEPKKAENPIPSVSAKTRIEDKKNRRQPKKISKESSAKALIAKPKSGQKTKKGPKKSMEIPAQFKVLIRSLSKTSLTGGVRKRNWRNRPKKPKQPVVDIKMPKILKKPAPADPKTPPTKRRLSKRPNRRQNDGPKSQVSE